MHNHRKEIKGISENNDINQDNKNEYQPFNTLNNNNNNIQKKFFLIKNETNSHRTSYTTNDSIYVGKYVNKKRNGHGKLILADQSYYEGNFKNGEFDGMGYYKTKNYIYKGQFISGKKNGKGKLEDLNMKSIYEGEFKNDFKDGYGIEKFIDGTIYKGNYLFGKREGNGILIMKKEKKELIYEGEFKNGKIWGKGKLKLDKDKEYIGDWENNEISGFGILSENGNKYIGYFLHDKKEGIGANFYINKKFVILGNWINDIIEGIGVIYILKDNNNDINTDDIIDTNDNDEGKIIIMKEGNIINSDLTINEINEIKSKKEYKDMIKIYKEKIIIEYYKNVNINI